jgi:hypothetical protein
MATGAGLEAEEDILNTPLRFECEQCKSKEWLFVPISSHSHSSNCNACGHPITCVVNTSPSDRFLARAGYECEENKDYPLTVVCSSISIENRASSLFMIWKDDGVASKEAVKKEWASLGSMKKKLNALFQVLVKMNFEDFVNSDKELSDTVRNGFQSLAPGILDGLAENLFMLRNEVLHFGDVSFTEVQAIHSINYARLVGRAISKAADISAQS